MFKLNLWLHIVLFLVAAGLLIFMGTPFLHDTLVPPLELVGQNAKVAIEGQLARDAGDSVTVAAALASQKEVRAVLNASPDAVANDTTLAARLLRQEHAGLGRPTFSAVLNKDGKVVTRAGPIVLDEESKSLPVVRDALRGLALDGIVGTDIRYQVGAHPIIADGKVMGAVVVGWPINAAYVDRLTKKIGLPGAGVVGKKQKTIGGIAGLSDTEIVNTRLGRIGEIATKVPGPFPLFIHDVARYQIMAVPLQPRAQDRIVLAVDYEPALSNLATLQAAVLAGTLLLVFLLAFTLITAARSVSRPMDLIIDHLSQAAQGKQVGVLPVARLKGPFVRLGKQINMVLEHGGPLNKPKPGTPPLLAPSIPPRIIAETDIESELDDTALSPEPELPSSEGLAPVATAPVSEEFQQSALSSLFDEGNDPLAAFRVPSEPPPTPAFTDPPSPAAPLAEAPVPPAKEPYDHESTVMVPVPDLLLAKSIASSSAEAAEDRSDATVVAEVPSELLGASVPNLEHNEDDAHHREVYAEFVRTREACGEDSSQLTYERFVAKLMKNRKSIIKKYNSKSVRFQVYVKQGKAALRAVPVRK